MQYGLRWNGKFCPRLFMERYMNNLSSKDMGYVRLVPPNRKNPSKLFVLIRFADDVVVLTKSRRSAELILEAIKLFLQPRGLTVSADKTKLTDITNVGSTFIFVGFEFGRISYKKRSVWLFYAPKKAIDKLHTKIRALSNPPLYPPEGGVRGG